MKKARRRSVDRKPSARPRMPPVEESGNSHPASATAVAAEAMRTGVLAGARERRSQRETIPHESLTIRIGDPDDGTLDNEYVGEDTPGGSTPTPDQNGVDEIGRAYGLQEEDNSGGLRSASEVLERRDRRRTELQPPRNPR